MFSDLSHSVYPVGRDLHCVQEPCVFLVVPELGLELGAVSVFSGRGAGGLAGCQSVIPCHCPTTIPREEGMHPKECSLLSLFSPSVLSHMSESNFFPHHFCTAGLSVCLQAPNAHPALKSILVNIVLFSHLLLFSSSHHKGLELFHSCKT